MFVDLKGLKDDIEAAPISPEGRIAIGLLAIAERLGVVAEVLSRWDRDYKSALTQIRGKSGEKSA